MNSLNDTIVALSTPPMGGALALIRVSGPSSFEIVNKVLKKKLGDVVDNKMVHNYIVNSEEVVDEVMLFLYKGAKSFCGEDMIEITCHGSMLIVETIIQLLIKNGCRLAEKGEFSKRAFYNKKIDLLQAEAINDVINATSKSSLMMAQKGLSGELSLKITEIKDELIKLLSSIEVNIDYPEYEDVVEYTAKTLLPLISDLINKLDDISKNADIGLIIKNGINVALIGKPNVGKSSLLNALLMQDKAIVSDIEGTTRDIVEGSILINGLQFNFLDTAGIRNALDKVEQMGISKTNEAIDKANIILFVTENKKELDLDEKKQLEKIKDKKVIIVYNKSDLVDIKHDDGVLVSAAKKDIETLKNKMLQEVGFNLADYTNKPLLSNIRQKGLIEQAKENLVSARHLCENTQPVDIIEIEIKQALESIQSLLGERYQTNFSEEIFKHFCLGK